VSDRAVYRNHRLSMHAALLLAICETGVGERGGTCIRARGRKRGGRSRVRRCPMPVVLRRSCSDPGLLLRGAAIVRVYVDDTDALLLGPPFWRRLADAPQEPARGAFTEVVKAPLQVLDCRFRIGV
jgi:hypothetical protein